MVVVFVVFGWVGCFLGFLFLGVVDWFLFFVCLFNYVNAMNIVGL